MSDSTPSSTSAVPSSASPVPLPSATSSAAAPAPAATPSKLPPMKASALPPVSAAPKSAPVPAAASAAPTPAPTPAPAAAPAPASASAPAPEPTPAPAAATAPTPAPVTASTSVSSSVSAPVPVSASLPPSADEDFPVQYSDQSETPKSEPKTAENEAKAAKSAESAPVEAKKDSFSVPELSRSKSRSKADREESRSISRPKSISQRKDQSPSRSKSKRKDEADEPNTKQDDDEKAVKSASQVRKEAELDALLDQEMEKEKSAKNKEKEITKENEKEKERESSPRSSKRRDVDRPRTEVEAEAEADEKTETAEAAPLKASGPIYFTVSAVGVPVNEYICAVYGSSASADGDDYSLLSESDRVRSAAPEFTRLEVANAQADQQFRFVIYEVEGAAALDAERILGFASLARSDITQGCIQRVRLLDREGDPLKRGEVLIRCQTEEPIELTVAGRGLPPSSYICGVYYSAGDSHQFLSQTERATGSEPQFEQTLSIPPSIDINAAELRFVLYLLSSDADSVTADKIFGNSVAQLTALIDDGMPLPLSDSEGAEIPHAELIVKANIVAPKPRKQKENKKPKAAVETKDSTEPAVQESDAKAIEADSDDSDCLRLLVSGHQFPLNDYMIAVYRQDDAGFSFLSQTERVESSSAPQFRTSLTVPRSSLTEAAEYRFAVYAIPDLDSSVTLAADSLFGNVILTGAALESEKEIRIRLLDSEGNEMEKPALIVRRVEIAEEQERYERRIADKEKRRREKEKEREVDGGDDALARTASVDLSRTDSSLSASQRLQLYPPHLATLPTPLRVKTLREFGDSILFQQEEKEKTKEKKKGKSKSKSKRSGQTEEEYESESDSDEDAATLPPNARTASALSAFSFDHSRSVRAHLPENRSPAWVDPREGESVISLFVATWNRHAREAPASLQDFLPHDSKRNYDIYVIGTQECEGSVEMSLIRPSKAKWVETLRNHFTSGWVELCQGTLQASHLIVFVRKTLLPYIHSVQCAAIPTGIGNVIGNKGGIGISFEFGHTSFLFINAHFAPHQHRIAERNAHFHAINERLPLGRSPHAPKLACDRFDRVFWMGDLNYRINGNRQMVDALLEHKMWEVLLVNDQLNQERLHGRVFEGFIEGPINFAPTYKFDHESDRYDTSAKMRIPAYTDRILWKPNDAIAQQEYSSVSHFRTSDHRPVIAAYRVRVRLADMQYIMAKQLSKATEHNSKACSIQ